MSDILMEQKLLNIFRNNLPGATSQLKMMPKHHQGNLPAGKNAETKTSAVLLLLFPEDALYKLVFIKRSEDGGKHSGQIAFPGGKTEPGDANIQETALREAEEEIGIRREDIAQIKPLTALFIPVSNYMVYPFVGISKSKPDFSINKREVQQLYFADIKSLLNAACIKKTFKVRNRTVTAPFFIFDEFELWGASAMMLSEFIDLLKTEFL